MIPEQGPLADFQAPLPIVRRDIRFDIEAVAHPHWFDGDPLLTANCDALSLFFPKGERFFIRAVRGYAPKVDDPRLQKDIEDFCVQEAYHTREHETYNRELIRQGIDLTPLERRVEAALAPWQKAWSRMIATVAIEHITATYAHVLLDNPSILATVPEPYRDLWTWHALEEMEHKAVAFDVFHYVHTRVSPLAPWKHYLARCGALVTATRLLHRVLLANIADILRARGHAVGWKTWLGLAWIFFGKPGFYRLGISYYLRFFLPGFHPWKHYDGKRAKPWLDHFNHHSRRGGAPRA